MSNQHGTNLASLGTDCISRQAAISAICNACGKIDCDKMDKCEKLQLPPANCSEFPNNSDTISRQAAIDEVEYNGKTLREWMEIIETASEDTISRRAAINVIPKKQNGTGGESWMKTYRRSGHNDCVDACVTALQGLPPVTYTKINPPSDYARQFGLIPKEDATDINVATKDGTNLASLGTDCISRQAVIEAIEKCHKMCCREDACGDEWIHYETVLNEVECIPPAEPKRGKWIRDGHHIRCDQCGMYMCDTGREGDRIPTEFCPNCGAKMEVDDE